MIEIQEKHDAIRDIEKKLLELHQVLPSLPQQFFSLLTMCFPFQSFTTFIFMVHIVCSEDVYCFFFEIVGALNFENPKSFFDFVWMLWQVLVEQIFLDLWQYWLRHKESYLTILKHSVCACMCFSPCSNCSQLCNTFYVGDADKLNMLGRGGSRQGKQVLDHEVFRLWQCQWDIHHLDQKRAMQFVT